MSEITKGYQERTKPFMFSMCNIVGDQIEFCHNGSEKSGTLCTAADDKHVEYEGKTGSLTALAKHLLGDVKWTIAGPRYFKYKGE